MRNNESFLIHGWMRNEMGLSGIELSVFALIHETTIDGNAITQKQIAESIGITERTVIKILNEFVSSGYVKKEQDLIKGKRINTYASCVDSYYEKNSYNLVPPASMKKFHTKEKKSIKRKEVSIEDYPISKSLIKETKDIHSTKVDDSTKDIVDNSHNKDTNIPKEKINKFIPPTVEQVRVYCEERKNGIDAENFVNFYESKGWMIGKNKMKNWKAAVRTWENKRKEAEKEKEPKKYAQLDDIF